ncbi:hypothetical protein FB561_5570 [Kribbella amoyensis]|uniref:Uncharacterized protein n=1 Tax=Kribbella amoyensis TaxID=996641 RepID=A0A561BZS3_9ACTN|nr:hypothetical protein [Kribbella amoyensis]TWD84383.1 hypothetical protein FB561_5570 [Kribbella amoyensis]
MTTPVQQPDGRTRAALGVALGVVAPEAMALEDGRVRLSSSRDVLEREAVDRVDGRLAELAAQQVSDERLLAEAVALLGAEIDHARGGSSPVDGATVALDRLLDVPNLSDQAQTEAQALLRVVLENNRLTTDSAIQRLAAERAAAEAAERPPLVADTVEAAGRIHREAQVLTNRAAPPSPGPRRRGAHRRAVGGKHRAATNRSQTVGTELGAGLTRDGRPAGTPDLTEDEALDALLQVQPNDLQRGLTAPTAKVDRPKLGVVTTAGHDPQYFRVQIGEPPNGLAAHTTLRSGSMTDPHVLRIDPRMAGQHLPRVWTSQLSGALQKLDTRSAPPATIFQRMRSAVSNLRGRDATAQYDQFRMLSRNWREAQLQPVPDAREVARLEQELHGLSAAIEKKGQPAPVLPWSPEARHVIAPDRTQPTAAPNTPAHLREQVAAEIEGLQKAAEDLATRAEARVDSAEAASTLASTFLADAEVEDDKKDAAAPERARKHRVAAANATYKAVRHTAIANSCKAAAVQANDAAEAYQQLLTKLDELAATGAEPGVEVAGLAQAAADKVGEYQQGVAATLPRKDVQHTVISSGRLPHLTALAKAINADLEADKNPFRFTAETLHRRLRSETRRVLSPDGVTITVGNDATADVSQLSQFKINLNPGELREVLNSPIGFDEGLIGQIDQGGYNLSTTVTHSFGVNGGASLKTVTAFLPSTNAVAAAAEVVNPGFEFAVGQSHSATGTAADYGVGGAVEVLNGEIMRFRSETPSWSYQKRTSALGEWSEPRVVSTGGLRENSHFEVGYGHTYTVPPPKDTVTLDDFGLAGERETLLPEHVLSRIDGLEELCDDGMAGLAARLNGLDRVGHDQLRGLIIDDTPSRLDETTRPGGIGRLISRNGRPVAYAQLETFVVPESAELLSDASAEHKIERLRVGFSNASGGEGYTASQSAAGTLGHTFADAGSTPVDVGPTGKTGRNTSREDSLNVSDVAIHPSVQRTERTVGVKYKLVHRLTVHKLDKDESFSIDGEGDAVLRVPANDLFRYGGPVPRSELMLDKDGNPRRGVDGKVLLKGDPQPTDENLKPPVWWGNGPGQLRGAGAALVQNLQGADEAYKKFVRHLSDEGIVPELDDRFRPKMQTLVGKDPALVASQLSNLERVGQQLARHRLETGYDQACQEGVLFSVSTHKTGSVPQIHTYRIHLEQDFENARLLGLNTSQTATNLHIGSNTTVRSRGRSKGLPWSARLGFGNRPPENQAGSTPDGGPSYNRSALGRFFGWATGSTVNGVTLTESTAPLADFEVTSRLRITEVTTAGDTDPIVDVESKARVTIDSEFCDRGEPQVMSIPGRVKPALLQTATWQHLDTGNALSRLVAEMPAAARQDSAALHHLAAFMNVRNLNAHPEMMTTEYSTGFAISPAPSTREQAIAQRGLLPRQASVGLTTRVENLKYVGSGHQVIGDINLTLASSSFTASSSTGQRIGVGVGTGSVQADGDGMNASIGGARSTSSSSSSTQTAIGGIERLGIKTGQHYQFVADLVLEAKIKESGLSRPRKVDLENGTVMLTIPERDALRMYGRKDLELPLQKVTDAVERVLNGDLKLDRRTTASLLRRYQAEKAGATDELALSHTDERLAEHLRTFAPVAKPAGLPEKFQDVAVEAEKIAAERTEVRLPDSYSTTLGAAQVSRDVFVKDGQETQMLAEVQATIAERVPDALTDPKIREALRSELGGIRWRGHADDILDPAGFTMDYPFTVDGDGAVAPRNLQVRVRIVFDGPATVSDPPGDETDDKTQNSTNITQGYDYTEEARSRTTTTGYSVEVGGGLAEGGTGADGEGSGTASAGLTTEATTSQTSTGIEQNTRMSRSVVQETKDVERGFRLIIDVDEPPVVGADTRGVLLRTLQDRKEKQEKLPPLRREARGTMTLSVPVSDINPPDVVRPEVADHRTVPLPNYYFLQGIQLHDENGELPDPAKTAEDRQYEDQLVKSACAGLGRRGMLTAPGVQLHKPTVRKLFSAATRRIAFERAGLGDGPWTPPLPVPGHGSRAVTMRLRTELSGLQVVSDTGETGQLGEVYRQQGQTNTARKSTRLLPTSKNVGAADGMTGIKAGFNVSDQVTERDSDTTGNRNETTSFESGQLVTVEMQVKFHIDARRLKYDRHNQPKVDREHTIENAATGVARLTMFRHELEAIQARMEAGLPPLEGWDADRVAAAIKRTPERRVSASEVVRDGTGAEEFHPYRPMVDALAQARKDNVVVVLTMTEKDGSEQVYRAMPDGRMTDDRDGKDRKDRKDGKDPDKDFGAAFATLHPQLALLAEGRVDLRALYDEGGHNGRFTGSVVKALQENGIPASALTQLDHKLSAAHGERMAGPDGAKPGVGKHTKGKTGTGLAVQ